MNHEASGVAPSNFRFCFSCDQRSLVFWQIFLRPVNLEGFANVALHIAPVSTSHWGSVLAVISEALYSIPDSSHWSRCASHLLLTAASYDQARTQQSQRLYHGTFPPPHPAGCLTARNQLTSGSDRWRSRVSAKSALATAGASGGTPGSPIPPGARSLGTNQVSTFGACARRTIP